MTTQSVELEHEDRALIERSIVSARRRVWWLPASASLYFAIVTLSFGWPALLGRSTSAVQGLQARLWPWRATADPSEPLALQVDGAASSFPWSVTYHDALRDMEFPFWDWHSFSGGYDLASNGVGGAMYPMHWLLWAAFEPPLAHDLFVLLHLWLGGLCMYLLLRHWRLPFGPALLGGTVWMLAPFNVGWLQAEMVTPVLIVTPLVFWSLSCALVRGSPPRIIGAAAALALSFVAGNIVVFLVLAWVAAIYAVARVVVDTIRKRGVGTGLRAFRTLLLIGLGAVMLSAYAFLPTVINLISLGRRTATLDEVLPLQSSFRSIIYNLWTAPAIEMPIALFLLNWCGRIALVLAVIGLLQRNRGRLIALSLTVFFTLLPGTPALVTLGWFAIPPLRAVSGFGRLTFLASFGVAVLAALGTTWLITRIQKFVARWHHTAIPGNVLVAGLAVAVVLELVPFAVRINPAWVERPPGGFFPSTPAHVAIQRHGAGAQWPGLTLPLSASNAEVRPPTEPWALSSFWGATSHIGDIDSVGGYDSAVSWRASAMTRVMEGTPPPEAVKPFSTAYLPSFSPVWSRLDLAPRWGVTHVYAPPGTNLAESAYAGVLPRLRLIFRGSHGKVWEVVDALRGPRFVNQAKFALTAEDALNAFIASDHDAASSVVLEGRSRGGPTSEGGSVSGSSMGSVRRAERGANHALVEVSAKQAGWLVMPIGYSAGWSAEVDGEEVPLRPADFAFTAVPVPSGEHTVSLVYRPVGFRLGALLTLGALLGSAWVGILSWSQARGRFRGSRHPRRNVHPCNDQDLT